MRHPNLPARSHLLPALAALFAGAVHAVAQPAAPAPPPPLIREGVTTRVAAHTWVIPDGNVGLVPNVGIVVGSRATLVIDTGLGRRNGETVVREVRKVGSHTELYLATTHFHPEHDLGAQAFPPDTRVIRAKAQVEDIQEFDLELARTFSSRSPLVADLLNGATYRPATTTFDREYRLDLGGVHVTFRAVGPTHTRGDTVFFVDEDRVLFAGDVAMPALPAFISPSSSVRAWQEALTTLSGFGATRVVPSHGDMGDGRLIDDYRRYLDTLQRRARELKAQGKTRDEAADLIARELQPAYEGRQPGRIAAAARIAYSEAP